MSKIVLSVKFVFFLLYTAGIAGIANILDILTQGNPPVIFYYFGMSTICSIPWVILIKDFRVWILKGHEHYEIKRVGENHIERIRNDVKGLLMTLLSFLCIMFLGIGYLNQIFYTNIIFTDYDKALLIVGAGGLQGLNAFLNKVTVKTDK